MKKITSLVLALLLICALIPSAVSADTTPVIKNIIYLIPDGGGYSLYDFANDVKTDGGFDRSVYPNATVTNTDPMAMRAQLAGSMTTAPVTGGVTDSAAAGTAMATGHKTVNGYLGVDKKLVPVANLVEAAQSVGKATGLIATYEWMHATPGAFSAHASNRSDYYNIYQQIENKGIEVVLGAGYGQVSSYATIQNAIDRGYTIVSTKADLAAVKPGQKIWGNIATNSLPYDVNLSSAQGNLAEMTAAALTSLSADEDGFFLMVEGSKVDSGGHANDAVVTTSEYLAFDAAFKVALDFAKGRNDTIIVAAPDHDTGGMIYTGNMSAEVDQVKSGKNPSSIGWTSTNHTAQNVGVWMYVPEGVPVIEGLNPILGDTPSTRTDYVIDNTDIAPYCAELMGVDLAQLSKELFVDVTDIGIYMSTTGKFTFNNGNKYAIKNQNYYFKDGAPVSMGNKQVIAVNGRVYAPAEIIDPEDWNHVTEDYDGITGTGTQDDPYVLDDAYDFIEFTGNMLDGEKYTGKYIRQDADIDLAGKADYPGIGSSATFAGTYDGNGHTINVSLSGSTDKTVFPYTTGVIMNLGVTGSVSTTTYGAAICRSLRAGSKMINCWSTASVSSANLGGLAWSNYGTMENCFFAGTVTATGSTKVPIATAQGSAYVFTNCYYTETCGATQISTCTGVTEEVAKTTLVSTLNSGRASAAATAGVPETDISYWVKDDGYPHHGIPTPIVTGVTVTPETATVNKGDGLQLTATVQGEFEPSQEVIWSIEGDVANGTYIADDGYLIVDKAETVTAFTVMAKAQDDGSVTDMCRVTVGQTVETTPNGTRARPYLIGTAEEFKAFSDGMINGQNYEGVYYRQTADIDMSGVAGYVGVGSGQRFAGTYDGAGHVINLNIDSASDGCLFPYTLGTIMNLGTTGTVKNTKYAAGICRSLRAGAKMINCWSTVDVIGKDMSGVTWSNYGTLANCYFGGTRTATGASFPVTQTMTGATTYNTFWVGEEYDDSDVLTEITADQAAKELVLWMNEGRQTCADLMGCAVTDLNYWIPTENAGPQLASIEDEVVVGFANNMAFIYTPVKVNNVLLAIAKYKDDKLVSFEKATVTVDPRTAYIKTVSNNYSKSDEVKVMLWNGLIPAAKNVEY